MENFLTGILYWLSNFIPLGIFITDRSFNIVFWNSWMEKNTNLKGQDVLNRNIFELFPELNRIKRYYEEVLQGNSVILSQRFHKYTIAIKIDDRQFSYMQQTTQIFPFSINNEIEGTITVIEDVTERVKREEEYKKQIRALRTLNEVQRSILSIDIDKCLEEIVVGSLKLSGANTSIIYLKKNEHLELVKCNCARKEIINLEDKTCVPAYALMQDRPVYISNIKKTEFKCLNPNAVSILALPLGNDRKKLGVLVLESVKEDAFDKDDIINLETLALQGSIALENANLFESLKESEDRYRILTEQSQVGVFLIQEDKIIYANPKLLELSGYSLEEMLKISDFSIFVHEEDMERFTKNYIDLAQGNIDLAREEFHCVRKNGTSLYLEFFVVRTIYNGKPALLGTVLDITDRKRLEEELRNLSITDPLTGLYNRRGFITLAEHSMELARRAGKKILIMFMDLDNMKWINDTLGHNIGDQALQETAEVLRGTFRKNDLIARIGGDEFVFLGLCDDEEAKDVILSRLNKLIEEHNKKDNRSFYISLSIGHIIHNPQEPVPLEDLLKEADKLMYEDKKRKKLEGNFKIRI
ncbi:MAG: diguanylate cyclase [bacterium]|nr:diguanylate cyclase [bacterium]